MSWLGISLPPIVTRTPVERWGAFKVRSHKVWTRQPERSAWGHRATSAKRQRPGKPCNRPGGKR
jgi:hypothetical protein